MNEVRRLRVYEEFKTKNTALLNVFRNVVTCDTHIKVVFPRTDYPGLVQVFAHQIENDVFVPVAEPLNKIQGLVDEMKTAKSISQMDDIVGRWVEIRDAVLESMEKSASWAWGKNLEFPMTGNKRVDHATVNANIQFQRAGCVINEFIDAVNGPIKELIFSAMKGGENQGARYANALIKAGRHLH